MDPLDNLHLHVLRRGDRLPIRADDSRSMWIVDSAHKGLVIRNLEDDEIPQRYPVFASHFISISTALVNLQDSCGGIIGHHIHLGLRCVTILADIVAAAESGLSVVGISKIY